jgi:hypothetical protein
MSLSVISYSNEYVHYYKIKLKYQIKFINYLCVLRQKNSSILIHYPPGNYIM